MKMTKLDHLLVAVLILLTVVTIMGIIYACYHFSIPVQVPVLCSVVIAMGGARLAASLVNHN